MSFLSEASTQEITKLNQNSVENLRSLVTLSNSKSHYKLAQIKSDLNKPEKIPESKEPATEEQTEADLNSMD